MPDDGLEPLRRRFRARCADDLAAIEAGQLVAGGLADPELASRIHRLVGLAGSFGYDALSALARVLDDALTASETPAAADIDRLLQEMRRVAAL